MSRVGTLTVTGLAVYQNKSGALWFRDKRSLKRVHGNVKWETLDGRHFRGQRPDNTARSATPSESESDDDEFAWALAASLQDEDAMLRSALTASLADVGGAAPQAPQAEAPQAEAPGPAAPQAQAVQCSICMEDLTPGQDARALPCSHTYHAACVGRWLRQHRSCPVCRERV